MRYRTIAAGCGTLLAFLAAAPTANAHGSLHATSSPDGTTVSSVILLALSGIAVAKAIVTAKIDWRPRPKSRLLIVATSLVLTANMLGFATGTASAHCPGTLAHNWGVGGVNLASAATGVRGYIGYVNGNPCTNPSGSAFTAEYVHLQHTPDATFGWAQMGMIKRQGWSAPRYYCEFAGDDNGFWHVHDGTSSISAAVHHYRFSTFFSEGTTHWECRFDSSPVFHTHTSSQMGWTSGTAVQFGGEVLSTHGQIGTAAPAKLLLSSLSHRVGSSWPTSNVIPNNPPAPYDVDEPAAGQLRNWTNAH